MESEIQTRRGLLPNSPQQQVGTEQSEHKFQVEIEAIFLKVVNYALQEHAMNLVQQLILYNGTEGDLENLDLEIQSSEPFLQPFRRKISCLPARQRMELEKPELNLRPDYLAAVTERMASSVEVTLRQGDVLLSRVTEEITVLPVDYWHGSVCYPELLASFVTPNHPALGQILSRASTLLGDWTGDPSLDAYQTRNADRVMNQAAAIYEAIRELQIAYAVAPASFEATGQRVRMCDTIFADRIGTCLDLTLLYAGCLEAAGLHPLLLLTQTHAFAGVWLQNLMFPEPVQDDASRIRKHLAPGVNEAAVVEMTCAVTGRSAAFDEARSAAESTLNRDRIEWILDVHRARLDGIHPLSQYVQREPSWQAAASETDRPAAAPEKLAALVAEDETPVYTLLPKEIQWERKLLDLGLRNTLINLRLTKSLLPIVTTSLPELENELADDREFSILPRPSGWSASEISFETMSTPDCGELIREEFQNRRLRTLYPEGELTGVLKNLYRSAKTSLEENGANTLYLAMGILRWYETPRSTRPRYAPIMLLPVEIIRKSAAQGYVIRLRDDEPQMNVTMLEKLKQDFGILAAGLDPLPMDAHGIDLHKVLTMMRRAVMDQPRWDVLEASALGIFSFSQFVMWNDLKNRTEDLRRNKIVSSLMAGKLSWEAEPLNMGQYVAEDHVLLPMPADASQLFAIEAACAGKSFVLHGPPGTGKSQTITSLIANALAQGKRVLFVAEKMAALEVVQKRLDRIGIGPFCLELHSNKSRKKDVLEQLRQASEVTRLESSQAYARQAEKSSALRAELDVYVRQLHQMQRCGKTLYQLIGSWEACKAFPDRIAFEREFVQNLTADQIESNQLLLERLIAAGRELGHPHQHPLAAVGCSRYSHTLKTEAISAARAYRTELEQLMPQAEGLLAAWNQPDLESSADLQRLWNLARQMHCWDQMPGSWAKTDRPDQYFRETEEMAQHFDAASQLESRLREKFSPDVLSLNAEALFAEYVEAAGKWFLPRMMGIQKLVRQLNLFTVSPIDKTELQTWLQLLRDYQKEQAAGLELKKIYGPDLEALDRGRETDWPRIRALAAQARTSAQVLDRQFEADLLRRTCAGKPELQDTVERFLNQMPQLLETKTNYETLLEMEEDQAQHWLQAQIRQCSQIIDHADSLKAWITFHNLVREARACGLTPVVDCYLLGESHEQLPGEYHRALYLGLITAIIDQSEALSQFSGAVFNEKIRQYQRADRQWEALSRQEVYCRLASRVPDFTTEAAHSSELGILQRAIRSGGRGVSIRNLFEQIPNLLPRLCPCMLMSPISAAQYLDPGQAPFDLVVFDEASQLPTCKAVGVLARGENAVIVGDPKQMPPTSFFSATTADEDHLEAEDLESILDDCLALNMPQTHLLWHYRSRHESLIAFSNSQFYDNKLLTFPSVNDRQSKVSLIHVDGMFERGKSRTNRAEAEAVVAQLQQRCHDGSGRSVGVVTFNQSQQELIDDLLAEACARDPVLDQWAMRSEEPVFIKNLENVQGDERDVILFSIGYGPDENGKVYMNFGPLNRDGGWRRLNVAVSRARYEMVVFSALEPEQIDLNKTKAEGVAALRSFLAYAQGRPLAVQETAVQNHREAVAASICQALHASGYETELAVGRSQYRVDVGVIDPKQPDTYLLGILLDGSSYRSAKTTRDREIAQTGVLEGLGWNILRVWSMDWWENSRQVLEKILEKLEHLQSGEPEKIPPKQQLADDDQTVLTLRPQAKPACVSAPVYRAAELKQEELSAEAFVLPQYTGQVRRKIKNVIRTEAPVSSALLIRRVVQSCGISRAGSRIQAYMEQLLLDLQLPVTSQGQMPVIWQAGQKPEAYHLFRVSGDDDSRRDCREVPVQEIANAAVLVLEEQLGMQQEDLLRETARKLGYTRMGANVLGAMQAGLDYAGQAGAVDVQGTACDLTPAGRKIAALIRDELQKS